MMEDLSFIELEGIDWLIIGARTRSGSFQAFRPHKKWVQRLVEKAKQNGVKVFLKPNLKYVGDWYPEPVKEMAFHKMSRESIWHQGDL